MIDRSVSRMRAPLLVGTVLALALAACGGGDDTAGGDATTTTADSPTPTATAGGTAGTTLQITTPEGSTFDKETLTAPAETQVTVEYLNDSNLPHNIHFFRSSDPSGATLAMTEVATGPDNTQTTSFMTPAAGSYYFHCDVHPNEMKGTLQVQ